MEPVEAVRLEKARDRAGAAFDEDAPQPARREARKDGARRDAAVLDGQGDGFDPRRSGGALPGDDEALDAVIAKRAGAGRQPAVGIDDDADRMRPADPPHREQGIVGNRRSDADDDGIDDGAQPVEMVEPVAAVDVVRMPGHGRGAAVERLADLPDHHEIVHEPARNGPKMLSQRGGASRQAGADRGERVAPAGIVTSIVMGGLEQTHEHPCLENRTV